MKMIGMSFRKYIGILLSAIAFCFLVTNAAIAQRSDQKLLSFSPPLQWIRVKGPSNDDSVDVWRPLGDLQSGANIVFSRDTCEPSCTLKLQAVEVKRGLVNSGRVLVWSWPASTCAGFLPGWNFAMFAETPVGRVPQVLHISVYEGDLYALWYTRKLNTGLGDFRKLRIFESLCAGSKQGFVH